ncbi:ribosome-associated translation inhibitor RaiA [Bifidobacterium sp. ESL0763]|uniref:ribosome hibernation-promoting factor, HPF/YfiA family n=1 Tax=Bifidobacterium sp. ESL0763 TaxID=2983227 RepID=UPI0023F7D745|nr:ribosome-associated translation inhibitor RaiA [Bifidobacterium sp. ESL0763]MDF7664078.1 ribosome-associated translation inhibitor RaiA [Bifidobacterium sp. ESL0763]
MDIIVTGRHMQVSQKFRDVVETKMNRVTGIAPRAQRAEIVVSREGNPRQADTAKRVEITVIDGATVVRAEASSSDEFSALDIALDKLTLRLRRAKDRKMTRRRRDSRKIVDKGVLPLDEPVKPEPPQMQDAEPGEPKPPAPVTDSPQEAVSSDLGPGQSVEVQVGDTPIVIRRKLHIAEPMSIDEALYEMELIGHDFFLFVNKETNRPSVVYRRHGWSYGVFEIDTAEHVKAAGAAPKDAM